jgi:hypothetical protein
MEETSVGLREKKRPMLSNPFASPAGPPGPLIRFEDTADSHPVCSDSDSLSDDSRGLRKSNRYASAAKHVLIQPLTRSVRLHHHQTALTSARGFRR